MLVAVCGFAYIVVTESYASLLTGFFIGGAGAGSVYALSFYVVGCSENPDRIFGFKVFTEICMPALVVWILMNYVIGAWGFNGAMVCIIVVFAILALGNLLLPASKADYSVESSVLPVSEASPERGPAGLIWLSLFGLLLWMSGTTGAWVFLERLGNDQGFAADAIGSVLSIALLISALGALGTGIIGDRIGRKLPLLVTNTTALVALFFLWMASDFIAYALALCLFRWAGLLHFHVC